MPILGFSERRLVRTRCERDVHCFEKKAFGIDELGVPLDDGHAAHAAYARGAFRETPEAVADAVILLPQQAGDDEAVLAALDGRGEVLGLESHEALDALDERVADAEIEAMVGSSQADVLGLDHPAVEEQVHRFPDLGDVAAQFVFGELHVIVRHGLHGLALAWPVSAVALCCPGGGCRLAFGDPDRGVARGGAVGHLLRAVVGRGLFRLALGLHLLLGRRVI